MKNIVKILILAIAVLLNYSCDRTSNNTPTIEWDKYISWEVLSDAVDIDQTSDGGYILLGTHSFNQPKLVKIDSTGNIQGSQVFHTGNYTPKAIKQTNEGGYIVVGHSNASNQNFWVTKLDARGSIIWSKEFDEGANGEEAIAVECTKDGSFMVAGKKYNKTDTTYSSDYWIAKIANNGALSWSKVLGGSGTDAPMVIRKAENERFIIAGQTYSNDGDVPASKIEKIINLYDLWSFEISDSGEVSNSERRDGYVFQENKFTITNNRNFLLVGKKRVDDDKRGLDLIVKKLDKNLNLIWSKLIPGPAKDRPIAIHQTRDGGSIILAYVYSKDRNEMAQRIIKLSSDSKPQKN